jgi:hypothetical protein
VNTRGLGLAVGALVLAGCAQPVTVGRTDIASTELACRTGEDAEPANGVVLIAQAVPTASWLPCLDAVPLGWHLADVEVQDGSGRFWLGSDRDGVRAIEVSLSASCRTGRATEVPSDRNGVRRMELINELVPGYEGTRFYLFDGGCLAVHFAISSRERAEPLAVATEGIDLLPRIDVEAHVHEETGGRLELDPSPAEGG